MCKMTWEKNPIVADVQSDLQTKPNERLSNINIYISSKQIQ